MMVGELLQLCASNQLMPSRSMPRVTRYHDDTYCTCAETFSSRLSRKWKKIPARANFFWDALSTFSGEKCICACAVWTVMVTYRCINPLHATQYWPAALDRVCTVCACSSGKILMLSSRCASYVFGMTWWCTSLHIPSPPPFTMCTCDY